MKQIIIKSDKITLRLSDEKDLDFVLFHENHDDNNSFVTQWSKEQHLKAMQDSDVHHIILEDNDQNPVGYMIIAGLNNPNKSIELMRLVVVEKNKGYGREVLKLTKEYAFSKLKAHRLWLDVRENNAKAKKLYESEGFKEEGLLRECVYKNNKYLSIYMMSILENENRS